MLLAELPQLENEASKTGKNLNPLHKDGPKSGEGSPCTSQSPSQSTGFEDGEAALKGVHGQARHPPSHGPDAAALKAARQSAPPERQAWLLHRHPGPPDYRASVRKLEGNSTLRSRWRSRSTPRIEQAAKKIYDIGLAKVSTLLRPDGEEKANTWLAPDCGQQHPKHRSSKLDPGA